VIQGEELANVARHRSLRRDEGGDVVVDLALEVVDVGVLPPHAVGEVRVTLPDGAAGALE
jgi:hypothetical protein